MFKSYFLSSFALLCVVFIGAEECNDEKFDAVVEQEGNF